MDATPSANCLPANQKSTHQQIIPLTQHNSADGLIYRDTDSEHSKRVALSKAFNCSEPDVVFQELPNHVALAFTIHGCPFQCPGCHSEHTWDPNTGHALTDERFESYLKQYRGLISAVVFLGGEWNASALRNKLRIAKQFGLVTCLYSGGNHVSRALRPHLDFVKLGAWKEHLGGLDSPTTNQVFIELKEGELWHDRTYWFQEHLPSTTQNTTVFQTSRGVSYASA
ncbi:anaerobic ribonucleoside-triphosphate reductase activating protein [Litoribrevibacter albus]|uniref:Uncharacterized protein n=1 Tax=Litoribrevibacter albus TaxID=1473156 RepID=A0AA37W7H4_9GAMM|nr:anaerobic ribonucleoside-triphosphate reductase activating protein [Litoribrevibacter albus]GLQ30521.1 hypothetical protein GCM10007876_09990 [Litoribrevibacter albus]